ncbi:hypothetical protein ACXLRP_003498 [Acinetobacter baumannii]|uniref:Uncharacterized protein n=7 Tax=Acinetobacter baumannii TaxID=470 RepID=A0A0D5YFG8_ACIBA|nr:hypothetical protein [Acinetobacter baumannii]PXA50026.1 hypothetical protein DMB35_16690 [Acinetobacter baumannii A424]ACJ42075.2 hypothetical protein AB57_05815 [Acinetobacter baumannii AB0057]AKA31027.1 hypothetical protein ABUW_1279 [Acinetobacter baumannii]ARG32471.1 hypothetical protein B7L41_14895 [Acinetobacter baumannii]ATP86033.1 hypothetical protein A388_00807 [Acinetobacter baumannii]
MPITYLDQRNHYVWTTLSPKFIAPYCCNVCSETILKEGSWLCDYPVNGKTCDGVLCNVHAYKIAEQVPMKDEDGNFVDDVHVCPAHYEEWKRLGQPKFWERDK